MHPFLESYPYATRDIYVTHKKKSYTFDSHFHSRFEMVYCFCGRQDVRIGDETYSLTDGEAAVIFPNVPHGYLAADTDLETESVALICRLDFLSGMFPALTTGRPLSPFLRAEQVSEGAVRAFEQMRTAEGAKLLGWTMIALTDLLNELELIPGKYADGFDLAGNLITYIDANFQQPLTIRHLAGRFGYSSSYIANIFCEQLKVPFRTYLGAVRSEQAARLMRSTNKSLTEIAYECGYHSPNTFCRCFKRHFSVTPSEYKKAL